LDFRNTEDPYITDGYADFRFMGELSSPWHSGCENFSPDYIWWYGDHPESQLAVTEASADCIANVLQDSPLGTFKINKVNLNELFHLEEGHLNFDTTSLAQYLPIFEQKLGSNVPIELDLSYRNMQIKFGENDGVTDIDLEYILRIRLFDDPHDRLDSLGYFYDEIPIKQGFNLELHDDTLFGEMKYLAMNIHEKYG